MLKKYLRFKINFTGKAGKRETFFLSPYRSFRRQLFCFFAGKAERREAILLPPYRSSLQNLFLASTKAAILFICFFTFQFAFGQPIFKGFRENLGKEINDAQDQLQPVFSIDGTVLYFSNGSGANQSTEIWRSISDPLGHIIGKEKVKPMNPNLQQSRCMLQALSSHQYLFSGAYTKTSAGLQFSRGMSVIDTKKTTDLFSPNSLTKFSSATFDSIFRKQQILPFYQPFFMLYCWSQQDGDQSDIYILLNEHATDTSKPKLIKLPAPINSAYNEITPWMDDEGRFLYFASDRPGGFGELDIYVTERLDGTWQKWSAPKNLAPVNSNKNDFNFIIDPNETFGYFASNKNGFGGNDLFRIRMGTGDSSAAKNNLLLPNEKLDTSLLLDPGLHAATNITLLLDVSNSMAQDKKMVLLKKTLHRLIEQIRPTDKISIVIFGSGVEVLLSGQTAKNKAEIMDAIQTLSANGCATNISAGLDRAYDQAKQYFNPQANNQLYLITDGVFTLKPKDEQLVTSLPNIKLTVIVVGNDPETSKAIAPLMQKINGRLLHTSNQENDLNLLIRDVRSQAALKH